MILDNAGSQARPELRDAIKTLATADHGSVNVQLQMQVPEDHVLPSR